MTDAAVALFEDFRHVATHPRGRRPGERITVRDHLPPHAQAFFAHDKTWCLAQATAIGPACARLVAQWLDDRIVERLRGAQGVIQMARTYGPARLEAACARALAHDSPYYRTVKTILATGADLQPLVPTETPSTYQAARFARDAASLFAPPQQGLLH